MRNKLLILLFTVALFSSGIPLQAQIKDSINYSKYPAQGDSSRHKGLTPTEYSYGRVIWVSIVFLVLLIIALGMYKKIASKNRQVNPAAIRLLSRFQLSTKQAIIIVAIEDKKYALGATENNITLLTELGELTEEDIKAAAIPGLGQFGEIIKKMVVK